MTSASASRVTRSSRNLRLALVLLGGGLAVAGVLPAQEARGPAPQKETEAEATTEGTEGTEGTKAAEADAAEKAPPPKGLSPNRFEPTEKVRADFDVSFPIDI
jgi:hypothetical protein